MSHEAHELAALVRAVRAHLTWRHEQGIQWVPAGHSPRLGPAGDDVPPLVDPAQIEDHEPTKAPTAEPEFEAPELSPRPPTASPDPQPPGATDQPPPSPEQMPDTDDAALRVEWVRQHLGECRRCRLARARRNIVFGVGDPAAEVMVVGEAPGAEEDRRGEPFVGAAGRLLTRMIKAMGLARDKIYIGNIIKCRPPRNRNPSPEEVAACEPFLKLQIEAVRPRIIIAMGNVAAKTLLDTTTGITRLRGTWGSYHGVPVMPTFHPAYLLRNAAGKRPAWSDLQAVMARMDELGLYRER